MNCRELEYLVASRPFGALDDGEKADGEAHARTCHHCAPAWIAHARLASVRVPPMPAGLAMQCRALAARRARPRVLRFVPRGMVLAVGGFVVLAAAAGVLTARLVGIASTQRHEAPTPPPQAVAPVEPAAPALLPSMPPNEDVQQGDPAMKKSKSSKVAAVALGAATLMQAQQPAPAAEPQKKTAEEIIATNDLNGDGIVTLEEAAKVNGNLYVMFSAVYDADHDGRLDVAELKRGMGEVEVGTALVKITGESGGNMAAARPETILANNDLDKDGIVTKEEAKTAGKALYRMWDSYDLNKDGKVEYAELAKAQGY